MTEEKQIEEMAFDLCIIDECKHLPREECNKTTCAHCQAEALYTAGYRKQIEGEWLTDRYGMERSICSICGSVFEGDGGNYCRVCGAKMKGGE